MFKTIDDIMYMTDGNNPFREGLLYGRGGLGYKPTPYNMVGGGWEFGGSEEEPEVKGFTEEEDINFLDFTNDELQQRINENNTILSGLLENTIRGSENFNRSEEHKFIEDVKKENEILSELMKQSLNEEKKPLSNMERLTSIMESQEKNAKDDLDEKAKQVELLKQKKTLNAWKNAFNEGESPFLHYGETQPVITHFLNEEMDKERTKRENEGKSGENLADGKVWEGVMEKLGKNFFETTSGLKNNEIDLGEYATYDFSNDKEDADAKNYSKYYNLTKKKLQIDDLNDRIKLISDDNTISNDNKKLMIDTLEKRINLLQPYLQEKKYTGWGTKKDGNTPYFTDVNGEMKLYNVEENSSKLNKNNEWVNTHKYVNDKNNKDVNIYYWFGDGVYKYELNKDENIKWKQSNKKGKNGETLYIPSRDTFTKDRMTKDFSGKDAIIVDMNKLVKVPYFKIKK